MAGTPAGQVVRPALLDRRRLRTEHVCTLTRAFFALANLRDNQPFSTCSLSCRAPTRTFFWRAVCECGEKYVGRAQATS
jgi:hypothetical protein